MTDMTQSAQVFTVCHATGAHPGEAKAFLQELAASYNDVDAAARLLDLDGRCVYVIVWGWGVDSLTFLRRCLSELDPDWAKLIYIVGDPALQAAP